MLQHITSKQLQKSFKLGISLIVKLSSKPKVCKKANRDDEYFLLIGEGSKLYMPKTKNSLQ